MRILDRVDGNDVISPSEFSTETGCSLGFASYRFRWLRDHGLLELVKVIGGRGAAKKHMYRRSRKPRIADRARNIEVETITRHADVEVKHRVSVTVTPTSYR